LQPFFEPALEPGLKPPFICRSAVRAQNRRMRLFHLFRLFRPARPAPAAGQAARLSATAALLALLMATLGPAGASEERDHERARAAVRAGEVLPLPTLLERLHRTHPGQVLELELEREDDSGRQPSRWVYEIKLLQPDGQLLKLAVDARTGQVLQARLRPQRERERSRERSPDAPAKAAS
jgi:uncharacterized membrane protein YkoI